MSDTEITYCIVPVVDITQRLLNLSIQTSVDSLIISDDTNDALFKFYTNDELARESFITYPWKTHDDMKEFLNDDAGWTV